MKTAVIIPARYASTRFPGKPLALIKGKPLIQHVLERISKCKKVDFAAVATDDARIYNAVKELGCNAFMTPNTCKSGTDRIAFVAEKFLKDYTILKHQCRRICTILKKLYSKGSELLKDNCLKT